jgi:hypothetical protein
MDIIQLVKGDTGPKVKTTLTRQDTGEPFVADGDTVNLRIRKKGTTDILNTIEADWYYSEPRSGVLVFALEDFLNNSSVDEGFYEAEIEVTLADDKVMSTFELINIKVREQFG